MPILVTRDRGYPNFISVARFVKRIDEVANNSVRISSLERSALRVEESGDWVRGRWSHDLTVPIRLGTPNQPLLQARGVALHSGEVEENAGVRADDPCVVARCDEEGVPRTRLSFNSIVCEDVHPA